MNENKTEQSFLVLFIISVSKPGFWIPHTFCCGWVTLTQSSCHSPSSKVTDELIWSLTGNVGTSPEPKAPTSPRLAKVDKAAGVERESSLYRALSVRGNPRLSILVAVTKAIGLRLTVEAA